MIISMKVINPSFKLVVAVISFSFFPIIAHSHCGCCASDATAHHNNQDIVGVAVEAGSFKTLAAALEAAGLVGTLQGEGPFTVFAPTDDAFAKLPKGTVESLLMPENKQALVEILTYHVVAGEVKAEQVLKLDSATTVEGSAVAIHVKDGAVFVDNAKVLKTDVAASNGIIHVIDSVILPNS
jgi:uncharacterized surface protein with fasciclin (FAS1) repeats